MSTLDELRANERQEEDGPEALRPGRYEGSVAELALVLRVDPELGIISGDLSRAAATLDGDTTVYDYVASFRTGPGGEVVPATGSFTIIGEDALSQTSVGQLMLLTGNTSDQLVASFEFEQRLDGLPFRRPFEVTVDWSTEGLRDLAVEVETEALVTPIADFDADGQTMNLSTVFGAAGLQVSQGGLPSEIPVKPGGWDTGELHALMTDLAATPMLGPAWHLSLLLLSQAEDPRLLGVMFDMVVPQRQGAAVFATSIRNIPGIVHDRKVIQTAVHELGHALNLAHRFEREVGRADSLSHMNYDWRYLGGNHRDEFWDGYRFQFDRDELSFIRHGVKAGVIPGGAPFRSVRYWADGDGGYSPYVPEHGLDEFELRLTPPPSPFFQFGQPVFLELSLTNRTNQTFELPPQFLDPKAGFVEVLIRRHRSDDPTGLRGADLFVPLLQRCYDTSAETMDRLPPGATIRDNLNLTFGSSGFSFAEPGIFDVTALLVIPVIENEQWKADLVARSNTQRVQIAHPTRLEEHDLGDLFDEQVGTYFAVGGSPALPRAADRLAAVQQRRGDNPADPIVANILRCRGIDAQRSPIRYDAETQEFRVVPPDQEEAARHLRRLGDQALAHFDRETARTTRALTEEVTPG
jgi:hypothetical protein